MLKNIDKVPALPKVKESYSEDDKKDFIRAYIMFGGNATQAAAFAKIPRTTCVLWQKSNWFPDMLAEVRTEEKLRFSSRLKSIAENSLTAVEDRLANGDVVLDNRTGKFIRREVSLRDAKDLMQAALKEQDRIEKSVVQSVDSEAVLAKLTTLAASFEALSKKKPSVNVTDVVFVENVSTDEGETSSPT